MPIVADEGGQDRVQFDWTSVPAGVYVAALIAVGVLLLIVLVVGLVAYRRAKRTGSWRRVKLTVQAEAFGPGTHQDLARLRLRLDDSVRSAGAAVAVARAAGAPGDFDLLEGQLRAAAARLAAQLDVLADGVDDQTLAPMLPMLTNHVDKVHQVAAQLTDAATQAITGAAVVDLDQLTSAVADQLALVNYRVDALRELSQPAGGTAPLPPPESS